MRSKQYDVIHFLQKEFRLLFSSRFFVKGNVIVIIDKNVYITKTNNILNDDTKFIKITFGKRNKELDYLLDKQDKIGNFLKKLRDSSVITDSVLNNLKPCGSQSGVLYGLCKVHKGSDDQSPPFRPIMSAIDTPSYKIVKFLVPMLSELTKNKYVSKDSLENKIQIFSWPLDIDSLFTNLPLEETIDICVKKLFARKKKYQGFRKIYSDNCYV